MNETPRVHPRLKDAFTIQLTGVMLLAIGAAFTFGPGALLMVVGAYIIAGSYITYFEIKKDLEREGER